MSHMNGAMASFTRPWVLYNSVDKVSHYKLRGAEVQAILEYGIVFFDPNSWQNLQNPSL